MKIVLVLIYFLVEQLLHQKTKWLLVHFDNLFYNSISSLMQILKNVILLIPQLHQWNLKIILIMNGMMGKIVIKLILFS